jgi:hypothetical protein
MNRALIILILIAIVLSWNFIFADKQVGLTDQARVLQGLSTALSYKTAVASYWGQNGKLPAAEDWLKSSPRIAVDLSQTIVSAIEVGQDGPGVISVLYTARPGLESPVLLDGKKINLIPAVQDGKLEWICKGSVDASLLPRNCSPL